MKSSTAPRPASPPLVLGPPIGGSVFFDPQAASAAHLLCQVAIDPAWATVDGKKTGSHEGLPPSVALVSTSDFPFDITKEAA